MVNVDVDVDVDVDVVPLPVRSRKRQISTPSLTPLARTSARPRKIRPENYDIDIL